MRYCNNLIVATFSPLTSKGLSSFEFSLWAPKESLYFLLMMNSRLHLMHRTTSSNGLSDWRALGISGYRAHGL